MSELNQIKELEKLAIEYAKQNLPDPMCLTITQMMTVTDKYLGVTNEYLIDKEQE